ncbi:MM3350-like domain-containing protein [Suillus discolor]|uniref:MM3350-like domain-containing protein n=1 Tax=Suillus discolor TaxID=1912936 RepID=A0A9P7EV63_9AGAM|nr:MM3350-like domain-containing protein [Suillus discolor]KAG2090405.1 MM3350-like domain-containing protein [Suillus discolor]
MDFTKLFSTLSLTGEDIPPRSTTRPTRKPKFVKFLSGDNGEGMPETFFEDPRTFKPKPGPHGQIQTWGIFPYNEDNIWDCKQISESSRLYILTLQTSRWNPNDRDQLSKLDLADLDKKDIVIKIHLKFLQDANGDPRIWRRVRLSAGMKIGVFQDKVLSPILNWVRNLHCYTFTDLRDGAVFGPEDANATDIMHINQVGYVYLPDDKYMLAHLFSKVGDTFAYLYDYGDKWHHEIEIEKVFPVEESYGRVQILDGKGMCPGENMRGSYQYQNFLKAYDTDSYTEQKDEKFLIAQITKASANLLSLFDVDAFDVDQANERLSAALSSPNSVRAGMKAFTMPINPSAHDSRTGKLKKGQSIQREWDHESHGYWQETTSSTKDKRSQSACAACGKPGGQDLKTCSGCRAILYCSAEHQKVHWKDVHKKQCSRKYLKK